MTPSHPQQTSSPRTLTVRECSCADPKSCSQACGSEMVDRLYVEATEAERLREAVEALRSTVAVQEAAIDRLLRFICKAGFVLPQHAAERDRLIEEIEGRP